MAISVELNIYLLNNRCFCLHYLFCANHSEQFLINCIGFFFFTFINYLLLHTLSSTIFDFRASIAILLEFVCGFLSAWWICVRIFIIFSSISISDSMVLEMKCSHFALILTWSSVVGSLCGRMVDDRQLMDVLIQCQCRGNISDTITCAAFQLCLMILRGFWNVSMNFLALQIVNSLIIISTFNFHLELFTRLIITKI